MSNIIETEATRVPLHPANSQVVGSEVPVRMGRRCASCGEPVRAGGAELTPDVAFCADCSRRSRPGPGAELGVVD
jgi:hypothetical protein